MKRDYLRPRRVRACSFPDDESEHFTTCRDCGYTLDCRDFADVMLHEQMCLTWTRTGLTANDGETRSP
jgi:hypothetical protein